MNKIFTIIVAMVMMVGTAHANDFYGTGSITRSDIDVNSTHFDITTGFNVGGGMNLNNWLAVEGTYSQSGEASAFGINGDVKTIGAWIVADPTIIKINKMPLKFIARVGAVYNNVYIHNSTNVYDTGMAYGAGLGLGVSKRLDVILDYRTMDVDLVPGAELQVDTVGLGVNYYF